VGATVAITATEAVRRLLEQAVELGASDLHLCPDDGDLAVTARVDGVLLDLPSLPREIAPRVVGRLKTLADLLSYRTDVPQEGRIAADRSGIGHDVRVASYPTICGERVALRFDAPQAVDSIDALGLDAATLASLRAALDQPDGVILLTGPSGSGKTTTLYAGLRHLATADRRRSIVTVEDPVERRIRGVAQTEVNPASGLDFARALRSLLRQDPEVILVGEIRDRETAAIALEAGLTGHLVISTIHAGTAPQVFARLLEMGIEPFVITTAVRGVLAQRLLRSACGCDDDRSTCDECGGAGYQGRRPAAEWLPMSSELREAILARADGDALDEAARNAGVRSLREAALAMAHAGVTTEQEVDRVLGSD
jgi:general secretion pathway protein E